ncbi:snRNA-activating protein complex subunit 3 [Plakobranchus ocellatus]|uniref:snRNA-activating protein complex subunit 3 n=1 Tax=Plakobranchus ocellatus TaxID=259542 RepID=A0AAV4B6E0_9GAST|nr:snRNA-activating protein complex subunit 3 [Plakobranchus ocellatus]
MAERRRRQIEESELVNPREFMSFWGLEAHEASRVGLSSTAKIQKNISAAMNVSEDTVAELEEVCGKKSLFCGTEPKKKESLYRINEQPPQSELQCLRHQIESNKRREEVPSFHVVVKSHMKYSVHDSFMSVIPEGATSKDIDPQFRVEEPNIVLTVEVAKCLLHGAQAQLDMYKSGFFFIENIFYNDLRFPDNKDYSKPIIAWAKDHMPDTEMSTKRMSECTFFDLNIKLGHHYLFTHQGNCEHSVTFTDLRQSLCTRKVACSPCVIRPALIGWCSQRAVSSDFSFACKSGA